MMAARCKEAGNLSDERVRAHLSVAQMPRANPGASDLACRLTFVPGASTGLTYWPVSLV
jgi:hypothetical protein